MYKVPDTHMDWFEYESIQKSLQRKHVNMLENNISKNESICKWIKPGEQIEINGFIIKRGFFYVGDYFEIPRYFKNNIIEYNNQQYNKQYKLSRIYGPVIQENLPIENGNLIIEPFSCYYDMHPTHRYEYLSWLAGNVSSCELSTASLYFHLFGLQIRMFVDDTTDNTERIELIKHSIELYTQCFDDGIIASEFEQFIEAAISNFFPNNVFEIVHSDIVCNIKDNTRVDALHEICRRIINKYKQCNIPTFLVTDFLLQQASLFFETEFSKYIKGEKSEVLEGYLYVSQDYQFFRLSGSTCDALFCSDYLIDVKLKGNNFPICRIIDKSLKFFFKNTVRQLSEYKSLCKISPTLSLFTLPSVFNYCDYEDAVSYIKKLERKTEVQEYTVISTNCILGIDENIKVENKIDKSQITSIIKCIRKIGYGIIPNMLIDETRFNYGDKCILYRDANSADIDIMIARRLELLIKVCVNVIGTTFSDSDTLFIDDLVKAEVNHVPTRRYLAAYFRWIMSSTYKLTKTDKKDIQKLPDTLKNHYGVFLARIVSLDYLSISKREEKLKDILPLFGIESQAIHTLIHRSLISSDEEFATIEKVTNTSEFTIDKVSTANRNGFTLSGEHLAEIEEQTKQAQDLLSDIFEDDGDSIESTAHENKVFLVILKILLSKELWKREEVESLCKEHHLMIGSVLEQINDFSYTKIEDAVIEDDGDTIYVMTEYKDKLI